MPANVRFTSADPITHLAKNAHSQVFFVERNTVFKEYLRETHSVGPNMWSSVNEIGAITFSNINPYEVLLSTKHGAIYRQNVCTQESVAVYGKSFESHFVLRPQFGGPAEELVVMGDAAGSVHFWRRSGESLGVLGAHEGCINSVAFNPKNSHQMVTVGDDKHIRYVFFC